MSARPYHVLIVDDSPEDRMTFRRLLTREKDAAFSVSECGTGDDGLAKCRSARPDCLLLDYHLPDVDGLDFLAQLGRIADLRLPVVMLTGTGNEAVAVEAMKSGAQDYLVKGMITAENLQRAIRNAVEKVALRSKIEDQQRELERLYALECQRRGELEDRMSVTEAKLEVAREIQTGLLPLAPPQLPGLEIAGSMFPADSTGGDFFDFLVLPDGSLAVAVGDVCYHGLGAALIMAAANAYLRVLAEASFHPGGTLKRLNGYLAAHFPKGDLFVTLLFAHINATGDVFEYAAAAHRGYLMSAKDQITLLESTGPPLGIDSQSIVRDSRTIPLKPGDMLLLPTDGILEAWGPNEGMFGLSRLLDTAAANRHRPAQEIVEAVRKAVADFSGTSVQYDDMTLVVIKKRPS